MFKPWLDKYPPGINSKINENTLINLVDMFEHSFDEYADHIAFINMDETLTYRELESQSRDIATYLQQTSQLSKGDRVAIMMPNLLQYPIILLGILRSGLVAVNVNPLYTASELNINLTTPVLKPYLSFLIMHRH